MTRCTVVRTVITAKQIVMSKASITAPATAGPTSVETLNTTEVQRDRRGQAIRGNEVVDQAPARRLRERDRGADHQLDRHEDRNAQPPGPQQQRDGHRLEQGGHLHADHQGAARHPVGEHATDETEHDGGREFEEREDAEPRRRAGRAPTPASRARGAASRRRACRRPRRRDTRSRAGWSRPRPSGASRAASVRAAAGWRRASPPRRQRSVSSRRREAAVRGRGKKNRSARRARGRRGRRAPRPSSVGMPSAAVKLPSLPPPVSGTSCSSKPISPASPRVLVERRRCRGSCRRAGG